VNDSDWLLVMEGVEWSANKMQILRVPAAIRDVAVAFSHSIYGVHIGAT